MLQNLKHLFGLAERSPALPPLQFDATNLKRRAAFPLAEILADQTIAAARYMDHSEIERVFGGQVVAAVNPGDRLALYTITGWLKPHRVLEVGTHVGGSTAYISRALKRFVDGPEMTTVDIVDVNAPEGAWSKVNVKRPIDTLEALSTSDIVTFVNSPSFDFLRAAPPRSFDMIFLDGDHSLQAVYMEMAASLPLLREGGLIVLHDYYPGATPLFPDGVVVDGPFKALEAVKAVAPHILAEPLGELPWPTKQGANVTSLAVVLRN